MDDVLDNTVLTKFKYFELTDNYIIGHQKIDEDHGQIVSIVNQLIDAYVAGDLALCDATLNDFKVRLAQHFDDEDIIMAKLNFIDPDHNNIHEDINQKLDKLTGNCQTLVEWEECIELILHKFIVHILQHDFKFRTHLEDIGYKDN